MGKFRESIKALGLAAGLVAGEGAIDAQTPKQDRPAQAQKGPEQKGSPFNPSTELNNLIKDSATLKTGGVDLEVLKRDAEGIRKRADEEYGGKQNPEDSLVKIFKERADILENEYKVLTLLKQEVALWEQHIKNTADTNLQTQLFGVGSQLYNEFLRINGKLSRVARMKARSETLDRGNLEVDIVLRNFATRTKNFVRQTRDYYAGKGAKIKLPDPDQELPIRF